MSLSRSGLHFSGRTFTISLSLLLVFGFMLFHYWEVLFSPNLYLFSPHGDGIKNYYVYMYHIKHDVSYLHFSGMHYPYGDLFFYTDGNPVLASIVKFFSTWIPGLSDYAIGIYNSTMLLSILVMAWVLSLLFLELQVRSWANAFFVLAIVAMNPQIGRITGHFTLSYSWVIPLAILLYLRLRTSPKQLKYGLLLSSLVLLFLFIHPYLAIIPSALLLAASLSEGLIRWIQKSAMPSNLWRAPLFPLASIGIYLLFMKIIDPVDDRGSFPWGFYEFTAEFETVFIAHNGPMHTFFTIIFETLHLDWPIQTWEGHAYIGMVSILAVLWFLYRLIRGKGGSGSHLEKGLLIGSVLVLIYSFCLPFKMGGVFYTIAEYLGPLRQFRALGRFAWPFFYVITIFSLVFLYRRSQEMSGVRSIGLLVAACLIILWESHADQRLISSQLTLAKNVFNETPEALQQIQTSDYQAIMTLPYFMIGTDYYIKEASEALSKESMLLSYHTGLPLMSSMMSRTSIGETIRQNRLYDPDRHSKKPVSFQDMPSDSPFLMLSSAQECHASEKALIAKSTPLLRYKDLTLSHLPYDSLTKTTHQESIERFKTRYPEAKSGLYHQDSSAFVDRWSFEEYMPMDDSFRGGGSLKGRVKDFTIIKRLPANHIEQGKMYELSCWVKGDYERNPGLLIAAETHPESGTESWSYSVSLNRFSDTHQGWHLIRLEFTSKVGGAFHFMIHGPAYSSKSLQLDHCLIREVGEDVYELAGEALWLNNRPLSE